MQHATIATVDLAALRQNVAAVRSLIGDRFVLIPVKADAYGHGAVPVSRFLQAEGLADWLGVATATEAAQLRGAGVTLPILRLSLSFAEELPGLLALPNVALMVADARTVDDAEAAAAAAGTTCDVHLAIDTGMGRVGCEPSAAAAVAQRVAACQHLNLQGIGTHLPISDVADDGGFTDAELAVFTDVVAAIQADRAKSGLAPVPLIHAANSGAVLGHRLPGINMVRPGIMTYGYYPDATTPRTAELTPVMSLTSRVSFVKKVPAGQTVSYGRTWTAPRDTWIATVPVGYADGFSRLNSSPGAQPATGGAMLIGGRRCPVAGRVCMDFTMVDLGPAEQPPAQVGDLVTWLGRDGDAVITADDLAAVMGTISYEVLCLAGPRVPRVYPDSSSGASA